MNESDFQRTSPVLLRVETQTKGKQASIKFLRECRGKLAMFALPSFNFSQKTAPKGMFT